MSAAGGRQRHTWRLSTGKNTCSSDGGCCCGSLELDAGDLSLALLESGALVWSTSLLGDDVFYEIYPIFYPALIS